VAVHALFDAVLPIIRMQARKLDVRVLLDFEDNLPPVLCDRTMVEQVLLNLARNAMQAMDMPDIEPRTLELRVCRAPGFVATGTTSTSSYQQGCWLEFSVADCGLGINQAVAARLFTPFYTTRAEGMGLGLSLCRTVIEQHGGHLTHVPRQPRGTVFTFTLPA